MMTTDKIDSTDAKVLASSTHVAWTSVAGPSLPVANSLRAIVRRSKAGMLGFCVPLAGNSY